MDRVTSRKKKNETAAMQQDTCSAWLVFSHIFGHGLAVGWSMMAFAGVCFALTLLCSTYLIRLLQASLGRFLK